MLTTRRNPFSELAALERSVDRIFSEVFARPANGKVSEPAFLRHLRGALRWLTS